MVTAVSGCCPLTSTSDKDMCSWSKMESVGRFLLLSQTLKPCLLVSGRRIPFARSICGSVAYYSREKMGKLGGLTGIGGKGGKNLGPSMEKKTLPVITDPEKLTTYVCGSNIYKTGEDVKLMADSEYPDWLWTLRTGPPPPIWELDPETIQYWKLVRKLYQRHRNALRKGRKF